MSRAAQINDLDTVKVGDEVIIRRTYGGRAHPDLEERRTVAKVGRSLIHVAQYGSRTTPFRKDTGWINQDPGHSRILTDAMAQREAEVKDLMVRLEAAADRQTANAPATNRLRIGALRYLVNFWESTP